MSYVHSGSVLFQKQRVLCAEHAQTKSAPKPLKNTLHGKRALRIFMYHDCEPIVNVMLIDGFQPLFYITHMSEVCHHYNDSSFRACATLCLKCLHKCLHSYPGFSNATFMHTNIALE